MLKESIDVNVEGNAVRVDMTGKLKWMMESHTIDDLKEKVGMGISKGEKYGECYLLSFDEKRRNTLVIKCRWYLVVDL
jgi:hypothetical protein